MTIRHSPATPSSTRGLFVSLACVLVGFGVLMVHSASITSWPTEMERVYLLRHVTFLLAGVTAAGICASLPARFWYHAAPWLFLLTAVLLAVVLVPGVGTRVNGAQRWLRFGPLSLQPSELAKLALPLFVARLMVSRRERLHRWVAGTLPVVWPPAVVVPLVMIEPDLGTSLFLAAGGLIALFVGGWPLRNFLIGAGVCVPACVGLVTMQPYQSRRITGFLAAWADLNEAPYQLKQSLVSLGEGGLLGVGLGRGWQKLSFLPEASTDFVFAVVGEELGLVGTLGLLTVWGGLFVLGLRLLAPFPRRSFVYVAGFTLLTQLALQAALNMAVVTALVPPKGIPHPLISYGGSNLVVSLVTLGILLSLTRAEPSAEC
ncbi:MAG: FtsW/RodA/SpoVE family cell cycle protein [Planctomycetaceae bacterium]